MDIVKIFEPAVAAVTRELMASKGVDLNLSLWAIKADGDLLKARITDPKPMTYHSEQEANEVLEHGIKHGWIIADKSEVVPYLVEDAL